MESYSPSSVHIQFVTFYLFSQEKHKPIPNLLKYICALNPCAFSHKVEKKIKRSSAQCKHFELLIIY